MRQARLHERVLAGLIDTAFTNTLSLGLTAFADVEPGVELLVATALAITYFVAAECVFGQTIGKNLFNIRTVQASNRRSKPTFVIAVVRMTVRVISIAFFCVGYLSALLDKDNLTWTDKWSKSVVVKSPT